MSSAPSTELSCQLIVGAGEALIRAHALMLQPDPRNLDLACSTLALAIEKVTALQLVLTESPSPHLGAAVIELRTEISIISRLLEHAAAFHVNLIRCMLEASTEAVPQSLGGGSVPRVWLEA